MVAAPRAPGVAAVATIGAPFDPSQTRSRLERRVPGFVERGEAEVELGGRRFRVRSTFWEETGPDQMKSALASFAGALMVMHSPADQVVNIDEARRLFEAARHPKSFVSLDDADHLLSSAADAEYAADVIAAWASRYLTLPKPAAPIGAPEGVVRVSEADKKGFLQDITAGPGHYIRADEPESYGGTDADPPYDDAAVDAFAAHMVPLLRSAAAKVP